MGDLLEVELPCAREHAERGGGACLARSIAAENWHSPIEPCSLLPAESLALHQPPGMARPGGLSIAGRLGLLFLEALVICSSFWSEAQQLWKEQRRFFGFYCSTPELFMARATWDRQREHPQPQFAGLWHGHWGCSCTGLCVHSRAVQGYFAPVLPPQHTFTTHLLHPNAHNLFSVVSH